MIDIQCNNTRKLLFKMAGLAIAAILILQILTIILYNNIYYDLAAVSWDLLDQLKPNQTTTNMFLHLVIQCLTISLPVIVISLITYYLTIRYYNSKLLYDGETRCRKCKYILRGITEPRCPECGERI